MTADEGQLDRAGDEIATDHRTSGVQDYWTSTRVGRTARLSHRRHSVDRVMPPQTSTGAAPTDHPA